MSKYKAKSGLIFNNKQAAVYGNAIERIEKEKGFVRPMDVVEVAKSLSSPLHNYFDWNDETAADKYRLGQARYLMNHLVVDIILDGRTETQNAFFNVSLNMQGDNGYLSMGKAMSVKIYREQALDTALREYDYWEKKYSTLKELAEIFKARQVLKKKLKK